MTRRPLPFLLLVIAAAGCVDRDLPTTPPASGTETRAQATGSARERLAERLAIAMRSPGFRSSLKQKLDRSRAPEGKLQFQALARADHAVLLAGLAGGGTVADVLADLDAASGLELYLPVESHRAAWRGDANLIVATTDGDGSAPIGFDLAGSRIVLDPDRPPQTPVLALVQQETDFTGGRPSLATTCWNLCGDDTGGSSGVSTYTPPSGSAAGLYLTASHIEDEFESWLKGKPEYEYHVYGVDGSGNAEQLACTGEHAGGRFVFDQNDRDWSGSAMLLSEADRAAYEQRAPGKPIRVVAFEDDDDACVARLDRDRLSTLIAAIDAAYRQYTSGKVEPLLLRGIRAAPSVFTLVKAVYSMITTGDDFVGNAVETSIAGVMPAGANWALKTDGTRTTGWFSTEYRR